MAQLENSSEAVLSLRNRLNKSIEELAEIKGQSDKKVEDIRESWRDHRHEAFLNEYEEETKIVDLLISEMEEFDKKLNRLEEALRKYEEGE